jgi:hypothetical protein
MAGKLIDSKVLELIRVQMAAAALGNRGLKSLALQFLSFTAQIFEVADADRLRKYITKEND